MKRTLAFVLFALSALALHAEPSKLTNKQADTLYGALAKIGPGLSGANTMHVARAINTLRPLVEAYAAGLTAEYRNRGISEKTRIDSAEGAAYLAALEKLAAETVTVDLPRLTITNEEAERLAATTPPERLAVVLQYLEAKPAAPAPAK
jgi:hypothetical protein